MVINIRDFTQHDIDEINRVDCDGESFAAGRKIVEATDENGNKADLYVCVDDINRLGIEYMQNNIKLEYSEFFEKWFAKLSQNVYYNDLERYPEKIIDVKYIEDMCGVKTEIYKNKETGRLYMRMLCNEPFARWMSCRKDPNYQYVDENEIRANVIFRHKEQTEKITYNDWNGNAAYQDTFNPNFKNG